MCKDRFGYLWIATEKGIVKYNGYSYKLFNVSDGLSNEAIYNMYLDRRDRLWLMCKAKTIGYIYKDKYHKAILSGTDKFIYTQDISEYADGIFFINHRKKEVTQATTDGGGFALCIEKNDSIKQAPYYFTLSRTRESNLFYEVRNNQIINYFIDSNSEMRVKSSCYFDFKESPTVKNGGKQDIFRKNGGRWDMFRNYFLYLYDSANVSNITNKLIVQDVNNCTTKAITFKDSTGRPDNIIYIRTDNKKLWLIADKNIYEFDSCMRLTNCISLKIFDNITSEQKIELVNFYADSFWGDCFTTKKHGVYFDLTSSLRLQKINKPDFGQFNLLGTIGDTVSYWWNNRDKTLLNINLSDKYTTRKANQLNNSSNLFDLLYYNPTVAAYWDLFWFDTKTLNLTTLRNKIHNQSELPYGPYYDVAVSRDSSIYIVSSNGYIRKVNILRDSIVATPITDKLFKGVTYDHLRNIIIAYNDDQILIRKNNENIYFSINQLISSIKKIETITVDKTYGNIFIKDYDKLFVVNIHDRTITSIFTNYNLKYSHLKITGNTLSIAGRFGVIFSRILGIGKLSNPIVYPNIKDNYYRTIEDVSFLETKIILKTDQGLYTADIPSDSSFHKKTNNTVSYKVIINYKDSLYDLNTHHEIRMVQDNLNIKFDVINPQGNGGLNFRYKIEAVDSSFQTVNANELYLSRLSPGKRYKLSIIVNDEVWQSDKIYVSIYIIPYWWQTTNGILIITTLSFIILISLVVWVILSTRRYIARIEKRKRQLTELELRSVYSQLNPHFIFNTLNSALYLIKKEKTDEAYDHVSKFSRLLRAYLESSRNRYITISDEIVNLNNYIKLQQTRFGKTFSYSIVADPAIPDLKAIYIPSLLLQPIVENAINHGLLPLDNSNGYLQINFIQTEKINTVICTIEDNGIGRRKAKELTVNNIMEKKSFGTDLIKELVDLFNKEGKIGIDIQYVDKENDEGTLVTITIRMTNNETKY